MNEIFTNCGNLTSISLENFDTNQIKSIKKNMFERCTSLSSANFIGIDTTNLKSLSYIFSKCKSLKEFDLTFLNKGNVDDFS